MKKVLGILTLVMVFTLTTAFQAYSDKGIFTILSTGDNYTQTNALVLSMKTLELVEYEYEVNVLLCGDAVNLALSKDTTRLVAPSPNTPWQILGVLINKFDVPVYVCPLVFNNPPYENLINNYGLRLGVTRGWAPGCEAVPDDVVDPITPKDIVEMMNEEGIKLFTFGGIN